MTIAGEVINGLVENLFGNFLMLVFFGFVMLAAILLAVRVPLNFVLIIMLPLLIGSGIAVGVGGATGVVVLPREIVVLVFFGVAAAFGTLFYNFFVK